MVAKTWNFKCIPLFFRWTPKNQNLKLECILLFSRWAPDYPSLKLEMYVFVLQVCAWLPKLETLNVFSCSPGGRLIAKTWNQKDTPLFFRRAPDYQNLKLGECSFVLQVGDRLQILENWNVFTYFQGGRLITKTGNLKWIPLFSRWALDYQNLKLEKYSLFLKVGAWLPKLETWSVFLCSPSGCLITTTWILKCIPLFSRGCLINTWNFKCIPLFSRWEPDYQSLKLEMYSLVI